MSPEVGEPVAVARLLAHTNTASVFLLAMYQTAYRSRALQLWRHTRRVGIAHDILGVVVLGVADGNPNTDRRTNISFLDRSGLAYQYPNTLASVMGVRDAISVEQNRKLVAADPRNDVLGAHAKFEPSSGYRKQLIRGNVAELVVHGFEIVELDEKNGEAIG